MSPPPSKEQPESSSAKPPATTSTNEQAHSPLHATERATPGWQVVLTSKAFPTALVLLFATWLMLRYDSQVREILVPHISGVDFFGLKFTIAQINVDALTKPSLRPDIKVPPMIPEERDQILQRAKLIAPVLSYGRVLWVDDHPDWNIRERNFLQSVGVNVDTARDNENAYILINAQKENGTPYNVVISDFTRDREGTESGETLLKGLRQKGYATSFIFFVGTTRPKPDGALALTVSSADLLNSVFDALGQTCVLTSAQSTAHTANR